jgi:hypothetical protein
VSYFCRLVLPVCFRQVGDPAAIATKLLIYWWAHIVAGRRVYTAHAERRRGCGSLDLVIPHNTTWENKGNNCQCSDTRSAGQALIVSPADIQALFFA